MELSRTNQRRAIEAAVPGAKIADRCRTPARRDSPRCLIDHEHALAVAKFLRDDPALRLDYASNVTGVDWLDRTVTKKMKVKTGRRWRGEGSRGNDRGIRTRLSRSGLSSLFDGAEARAGDHSHAHGKSRGRRASAVAHADLAQRANFRSARFSISTEFISTAIPICGAS